MPKEKEIVIGYCVKCREKKIMIKGVEVVMKNGRNAVKGQCQDCRTGMYRILPSKKI